MPQISRRINTGSKEVERIKENWDDYELSQ